jgi:hypothetical protein
VSWAFSFDPIAIAAGGLLTVDPQSEFSRFARELHRSVPLWESAAQFAVGAEFRGQLAMTEIAKANRA